MSAKKLLCLLFAAVAATIAAYAGAQAPAQTPTVGTNATITATAAAIRASGESPDAVSHGSQLFVANCGSCHGNTAKGTNLGSDLIRSKLVEDDVGRNDTSCFGNCAPPDTQDNQKGQLIAPIIRNGLPEKGMPKFTLTDAQIADIVSWLHVQVYGAANRSTYEYLNIVVGDPKKGEAFFNGAGKCITCHSATGDLAGIGGKYAPPALQSLWVSPAGARFGRGRGPGPGRGPGGGGDPGSTVADNSPPVVTKSTTTITVTMPDGQKLDGVPISITDFNITFRDMSGAYHSITRNGDSPKVEMHDPLQAHSDLARKLTDDDMHNVTAYLVTLK